MSNVNNIYKFRLVCETDGYQYVWGEQPPTTCPLNTAHTINTGSVTVVNKWTKDTVKIEEEDGSTGGHFKVEGRSWDLIKSTQDVGHGLGVTVVDHVFIIPIAVLGVFVSFVAEQIGDIVELFVSPETTIGYITAPVAQGATTINVSSTVFVHLKIGFEVLLDDGALVSLGKCINVDSANNQISFEHPTPRAFSPASPTFVKLTIRMIDNLEIGSVGRLAVGTTKIGASSMPAGRVVRVKYQNTTDEYKRFRAQLEYLY